jgi:ABC-type multidrug transport system ATPase subunit
MYDRVGTFSRGMKQRLSIARVLIYNPKVLFLDEPYTGLDPQATELLDSLLIKFNRVGGTVVMTTHNLERGLRLGDRILVLARGNIKLDQPSKKLNIKKLTSKYQQVIEEDD